MTPIIHVYNVLPRWYIVAKLALQFFLYHCLFSNQAPYAMRVTFWWSKAGHHLIVLVR
jgi:hypothetical protein